MSFKVCHLTSAHPDGDIRIFHKSCVTLAQAGFETYCVVPNSQTRKENGVHIVSFQVESGSRMRRFNSTVKRVLQEAIQIQADIYHLHDPELLLIAKKLKKATGARIIFDSHEDVPKQILDKTWIPSFLRSTISKAYTVFEMRNCKKLDAIISVTPIICERFAQFHPKVVMVANYPDLKEFDVDRISTLEKIPRSICYVGGFSVTRGIRELILSLDYIDAELHLAGWFDSADLEDEIKNMSGWKKVKFYGKVNREQVQEILSKCEIGIVTLLPTASYKEAYPIKMFEYMAAGIPVLASDFPLWRALVEKYGCAAFVDPCEPKKIAEELNLLFSNADLSEMGENGRKAIQTEINWENEARKLVQLYNDLLS